MPIALGNPQGHAWNFYLAGGLRQVKLESAEDLRHLGELDQKLWVALSMPTRGIEFDSKTLDLIDTDKDGRVRAGEVLAAVSYVCRLLKDPADIRKGSASLPLSAINDATAEGKSLLSSARQILANLGKASATEISAADTADTAAIFAATKFNGDGIIVPASVSDAFASAVVADIIATLGSKTDRSGAAGVDQGLVNAFFGELAAVEAWWKQGETTAASLPLGDKSAAAAAALAAVRTKIDDYFARCRLASYDARAASHLNRADGDYAAVAAKDLSSFGDDVAGLPLAQVAAGRDLPLGAGLNPAWTARIDAFVAAVVTPVLGAGVTSLSPTDWAKLQAAVAPYEAWASAKPAAKVEALGKDRIRAILGSNAKELISAAIVEDLKLKPEAEGIAAVDTLVRYHRDLSTLLNNFVNFADFYDPRVPAVFQAGTLFLDSRSCDLCIEVADAGAHSALGSLGKFFIAYCECTRPGGAKKVVAALFTEGDSDYLMVGRNGVFYDRKGLDWDARITKIVDNPVSIRQAFWAPYKKFVRMIEEQVAKRASAAEAASEGKLATAAASTANVDKAAPAPAAAPSKKFDLAIVTGIGVALGSIGTFVASIFAEVIKLFWWQYPLVIVGLMLAISFPSMILAWLKLRQRTLGPVLDANGWAINGRVKVNIPLGSTMTHVGRLPPGAVIDPTDPFADKKSPWPKILVVVLILTAVYVVVGRNQGWPLPEALMPAPEAPAK